MRSTGLEMPHQFQHLHGTGEGFLFTHFFMAAYRLDDLSSHLLRRVQGGHGILKDHPDFTAPQFADFLDRQACQVCALEEDAAAVNTGGWGGVDG